MFHLFSSITLLVSTMGYIRYIVIFKENSYMNSIFSFHGASIDVTLFAFYITIFYNGSFYYRLLLFEFKDDDWTFFGSHWLPCIIFYQPITHRWWQLRGANILEILIIMLNLSLSYCHIIINQQFYESWNVKVPIANIFSWLDFITNLKFYPINN